MLKESCQQAETDGSSLMKSVEQSERHVHASPFTMGQKELCQPQWQGIQSEAANECLGAHRRHLAHQFVYRPQAS